jgi:hypothetical protein
VIGKVKFRMSTVLLSSLTCGLLVLFAVIWRWGQERVHAPEHLAARHLAPPDLSVLNAGGAPTLDVAAIRDNAVFYAHRVFFKAPPPGQSVPAPDYDFAGSIGLPQGKRVAFVKRKSDKTNRTLHVGDDLDGWRVEAIEVTRVVIEHEEQRVELKAGTAAVDTGIVRGAVTPFVAQSGIRTMGGGTAAAHPPQAVSHAARTYQPPPRN